MADLLKNNPNAFWKLVNTRRSTRSLPRRVKLGSQESSDPTAKADQCADFLESVFIDSSVDHSILSHSLTNDQIYPQYSCEQVATVLGKLNASKGPGPDAIPNSFIKSLAIDLVQPLQLLFNTSLRTGKFPAMWKESYVTPIFKAGDRSNVTNYRGVALQSAIPKSFEQLICTLFDPVLDRVIGPEQHGFRSGHSTELISWHLPIEFSRQ